MPVTFNSNVGNEALAQNSVKLKHGSDFQFRRTRTYFLDEASL